MRLFVNSGAQEHLYSFGILFRYLFEYISPLCTVEDDKYTMEAIKGLVGAKLINFIDKQAYEKVISLLISGTSAADYREVIDLAFENIVSRCDPDAIEIIDK